MIAICVGHSRKIGGRVDGGAEAVNGVTEHTFNVEIARLLSDELAKRKIDSVVVSEYGGASYWEAMRWLGRELPRYGNIEAAIELHFNDSDDAKSRGFDFLPWHASRKGQLLEAAFDEAFLKNFPSVKNRQTKDVKKGDRGESFLRLTPCPALICEPFFGSNRQEVAVFMSEAGKAKLVDAYANAIQIYLNGK